MMSESELKMYYEGKRDGVELFAWWKDGTQYVGTCGKTLKEALNRIKEEELQKRIINCRTTGSTALH